MTHDIGAGVGNIRSRRLLLLERTMYREGRTPFTSVFSIQLLGRLEEGRLRQALARLQAKHPLLRCVIEDGADSEGPRFVLRDHPAPIPLRIFERKHDDDWQTEVRREWVAPFEASRDPLVRPGVVTSQRSQRVDTGRASLHLRRPVRHDPPARMPERLR